MEEKPMSKDQLDDLVEKVLKELKHRLQNQSGGSGQRQMECVSKAAGKVLVLGSLTKEEEQMLSAFCSWCREEEALEAFGCRKPLSWDMLLVTELSLETMACTVHGIWGTPHASYILESLLQGKRVCILESGLRYRSYKESAAKTLYSLLMQQEDTLRHMGIQIIRHIADALEETRPQGSSRQTERGRPDWNHDSCMDFSRLHLLKESDLARARNEGCLTVLLGRDTKITPLAMDYIASHHLSICRQ